MPSSIAGAPVAQRIECRFAEPETQVRLLAGAVAMEE